MHPGADRRSRPIAKIPLTLAMNLRMLVEDAITPAQIRDTNASVYVTLSRKPA